MIRCYIKEINFAFVSDPVTAETTFAPIHQDGRTQHVHYFIFHPNQYSSMSWFKPSQ